MNKFFRLSLLFLQFALFAIDFDCVVIGSSPFSLFEALYQSNLGNRVLILEEAGECGGAWKGIQICGMDHVDLGCHLIGQDRKLKSFLETYAGCNMVSLDNPNLSFEANPKPNGWYFSRGCYELIENLLKLIAKTDIVLLTNTKAETVVIDPLQKQAIVETKKGNYTTSKIFVTTMTQTNFQPTDYPQNFSKTKHYHLYLLLNDPTEPRFTYHGGIMNGMSRMMNLTHFLNLVNSGKQLVVIQTSNDSFLQNGQIFLDALKAKNLVDPSTSILQAETYIYESGVFNSNIINKVNGEGIVEMIQSGHFQALSNYIPKWEMVLKPYWNILTNQE